MKNMVLYSVVGLFVVGIWLSQCVVIEHVAIGPNGCQSMILDEWTTEQIEQQIPYQVHAVDFDTAGIPPALVLAALHDRWDAADVFIDYGADYELACQHLIDQGHSQLAERLEIHAVERRKSHPIIQVDYDKILDKITR